jgi:DNA-binding NtrC family response regulator
MNAALEHAEWDVILSDYTMPHLSALQPLETLKSKQLDVPFIIISGTIGEETAVLALKAGAQDYLIKGRLARLVPALEREIREAHRNSPKKVHIHPICASGKFRLT